MQIVLKTRCRPNGT